MIRILHIVGTLAPGGTTKQLALLTGALPRTEFEFHLCSLAADGPPNDDLHRCGIEPIIIGQRGAIDPLAFHRLRRYIRRLQPDIVHTWKFAAGIYGRLAALTVGVRRLVASERCVDIGRTELEWSLDRRLACRTNRIVTNSVAVRNFCIVRGLPPHKLVTIPSAVSPAKPPRLPRSDFLAELRLPADAKLMVYLGPLTKDKRLKELIWATDQLKAVAMPAHLLIVGDGPLRQPLERYRRLNRLEDRVHFLGRRGDMDVSKILAHADVLWQAGAQEGQSSALLEAMAAGIPVVAANAAGNRELVTNGETGYLVSTQERAGFARWTLPILEDQSLAHRLGATGRQRAEQCHRIEDMSGRYAQLYRDLAR